MPRPKKALTRGKGFGNPPNPVIQINTSSLTGNFLIQCGKCGYIIDSASLCKDAVLVRDVVLELLREHPLDRFDVASWRCWMGINADLIPDVDAIALQLDPRTGMTIPIMLSELDPRWDSRSRL